MSGGETLKIFEKAGTFADLVVLISQGDREEQQDFYGYYLNETDCYVAVCDGMGGYVHGELASRIALDTFLTYCAVFGSEEKIPQVMREAVYAADDLISGITDENGNAVQMGTTSVQVLIRGRNLYWNSVGDSRIYLLRRGQFVQVTTDHTYRTVLNEKFQVGQITETEMQQELQSGEKLVN